MCASDQDHRVIASVFGAGDDRHIGQLPAGDTKAVVSGSMQPFDAGQMKLVGFDRRDYRVIVLKSANRFRTWWTPVASLIIDSDPPGIGSNDVGSFKFQNKQQWIRTPSMRRTSNIAGGGEFEPAKRPDMKRSQRNLAGEGSAEFEPAQRFKWLGA